MKSLLSYFFYTFYVLLIIVHCKIVFFGVWWLWPDITKPNQQQSAKRSQAHTCSYHYNPQHICRYCRSCRFIMCIIEIHICCYDHISIDFPGTLRGRRDRQQWRQGHRPGYRCKHSLKSCWGIWDYVFGIWGCGFGIWRMCMQCTAVYTIHGYIYIEIYRCKHSLNRGNRDWDVFTFCEDVIGTVSKVWNWWEVALILLFSLFIILLNLSYDHLANVGSGS